MTSEIVDPGNVRPLPARERASRGENKVSGVRERNAGESIQDGDGPLAIGGVIASRGDSVGDFDVLTGIILLGYSFEVGFDFVTGSIESGPGRVGFKGQLITVGREVTCDSRIMIRVPGLQLINNTP